MTNSNSNNEDDDATTGEHSKFVPDKYIYQIVPTQCNDKEMQMQTLYQRQQQEQHQLQQQQQQQQNPQQKYTLANALWQSDDKTMRTAIFKQIMATCAVLLLSAGCGMPIGYSAVLLPQLYGTMNTTGATNDIAITVEMGSWIASVHSLATPVGSFISGPLADSIGRRTTLLMAVVPMLLGWATLALAQSYPWLIAGRFLCGFAVGLLGGPGQVYIAETTDAHLRSLLIGTPFVAYSMGILIVYALGAFMHWRVVAWSGFVLPIIAVLAIMWIPETPAWLLRHGKLERARRALMFLRCSDMRAQKELNEMVARLESERGTQAQTSENIFKLCCQRVAIKPLVIVIVLCFLQMFSGTYIVVFYAIDIIADFGATLDSKMAAIWMSAVRLLCTVIFCVVLLFVRRRRILIASGVGSGLSCLVLSAYMYAHADAPKAMGVQGVVVATVCLLSYIASNTALMVMPGIMVGELFPARIRGRTAGTVFAAMNVALFGFAKAFPFIQAVVHMRGVFAIFAVSSFLVSIFMALFQPETKGHTLEQIEDYFKGDNWLWCHRDKRYQLVPTTGPPTTTTTTSDSANNSDETKA